MGDQCLVIGGPAFDEGCIRLRNNPSAALNDQRRFQRFDIIRQRFVAAFHDADGIIKSAICGDFFLQLRTFFYAYPALCGRKVCCGFLQSIASSEGIGRYP
jgi:hypothetical protein